MEEETFCFASGLTTETEVEAALSDLVRQIRTHISDDTPLDLGLLLLSPHFRMATTDIVNVLRTSLDIDVLLGCTGEGVIGSHQEVEGQPAMSLVVAQLPGVELMPFVLRSMNWERTLDDLDTLEEIIAAPDDTRLMIMLADPFTTPMDAVLETFNDLYPNLPIIGGMASGSPRAGGNALFLNESVSNNGAVGLALAGDIDLDVIVSQGCRPVGEPLTVTAAEKNIIFALEDQPPLEHLQTIWADLSPGDQTLMRQGLFLGRAINPNRDMLGRGDFLIRGVMGIDQQTGALVVGDHIEVDETVQFHVRDAATAAEDLEMMLAPQQLYGPASGGLLFSCNGRGTRLYDHPDGDISTIQKVIGEVDLAGFFCAGEIGPIGGRNFVHGHTASMVLFRPLSNPFADE